jgi:hypothetical protein
MRVTNFKSTKDSTLLQFILTYILRFDNRTGRVQAANINVNSNFSYQENDYFNYGFSSTPD